MVIGDVNIFLDSFGFRLNGQTGVFSGVINGNVGDSLELVVYANDGFLNALSNTFTITIIDEVII